MLQIEADGGVYFVDFFHPRLLPWELEGYTGDSYAEDDNSGKERRCTFAKVLFGGKEVSLGISVCHPNDNFCKAIGRKRSLTDAIGFFPRNVRRLFWSVYKKEFGI